MENKHFTIRSINTNEFNALGDLMIDAYAHLEGFPSKEESPKYYEMLANIGEFTKKPATELLVAVSSNNQLLGGVVYFSNMAEYGSGGTAKDVTEASGIRLLAVGDNARGMGVGKGLTLACIQKAMAKGHRQVVLHTTKAMQVAWTMYEKLGFKRFTEIDFKQGELDVYGFQLILRK